MDIEGYILGSYDIKNIKQNCAKLQFHLVVVGFVLMRRKTL